MIKNLTSVLIAGECHLNAKNINEDLFSCRFTPCTAMQAVSVGWDVRGEEDALALKIGNHIVMTYVTEKKSIPGPVFKQALKDEVKIYERQQGELPGRPELKIMKEAIIARLLPRAFPKRSEMLVWFDIANKSINFNTSTASRMEEALSSLTRHVNNFPNFTLIHTEISPSTAMSEWLLNEAPDKLTVDDQCELVSPSENNPTIKYVRHSLIGEDVRDHIVEGKIPVSLAMTFNDRISFTLNSKLSIKSIVPLGVIGGELEEAGAETNDELFAAEFLIMAEDVGQLLQVLIASMGGLKK